MSLVSTAITGIVDAIPGLSEVVDQNSMQRYFHDVVNRWPHYLMRLAIAIVVFIVCRIAIGFITRNFFARSIKRGVSEAAAKVIVRITKIVLYTALVLGLMAILGIPLSGSVFILIAIFVLIVLALKDSLTSFVSSLVLTSLRPFKEGDLVSLSDGKEGLVARVTFTHTILICYDRTTIFIPNSSVTANSIVNKTGQGVRRIEPQVTITYDSDADKAKAIIEDVLKTMEYSVEPESVYSVATEFEESGIRIKGFAFVPPQDYLLAKDFAIREVKKRFDAEKIVIAYPTIVVEK